MSAQLTGSLATVVRGERRFSARVLLPAARSTRSETGGRVGWGAWIGGGGLVVVVMMMMVVMTGVLAHKLLLGTSENGEGGEGENESKFHRWY